MISKSTVLFLFMICPFLSIGQKIITDSLWFNEDKSFRKYKVWLPPSYSPNSKYQTIYCFDGEMLFDILSANVGIYSDPFVCKIPPSIVVGIFFDDRNDDMGIDWDKGVLNKNGTSFKRFIAVDLIQSIETEYATSKYRSIVGHSNSTTYSHFFLWDDIPLFQGYLSFSQYELGTDKINFSELDLKIDRAVDFVCVSGEKDADFRVDSGESKARLLDSLNILYFKDTHLFLPKADHITVVPQGVSLGLEALYSSFALEVSLDSILKFGLLEVQDPLEIVDSILLERTEKYGVEPSYNMYYLDMLFSLYVEVKDSIGMSNATAKYAEMFMDSSEFFYEAQCLESMGAYSLAEERYLKHLNYYSDPGYWAYVRTVWLYAYKLNQPNEAIYWCEVGFKKHKDQRFKKVFDDLAIKYPKKKEKIAELLEELSD